MFHVLFFFAAIAASPPPPSFTVYEEVSAYARFMPRAHVTARVDVLQQYPSYTTIRPGLHYRWRNVEAAVGTSWINHYENQYADTRSYLEQRPFAALRLKQPASYGGHYEQVELQLRLYANAAGVAQRVPRVVLRYGEDLQRFRLYEEVAVNLSDGSGKLDYERLWTMYRFELGSVFCDVGLRVQESIKSAGEAPNLTFGPQIALTFGDR